MAEPAIIVTHTGGLDRWTNPTTTYEIDYASGILTIKAKVEIPITQEEVDALPTRQRQTYAGRIGEVETVEVDQACYAAGYWLRVLTDRDGS